MKANAAMVNIGQTKKTDGNIRRFFFNMESKKIKNYKKRATQHQLPQKRNMKGTDMIGSKEIEVISHIKPRIDAKVE